MRRLAHVIPSVPIKDHTIVGTSVRVRTLDGSKDVWGARREPKGRPCLNVLVAGRP